MRTVTVTRPVEAGRPIGNVRIGRRFSEDEVRRIGGGEVAAAIVAAAPRALTRAEVYAVLFAAEVGG